MTNDQFPHKPKGPNKRAGETGPNKTTHVAHFTPVRHEIYLNALQETGNYAAARGAVGISLQTVAAHRRKNIEFARAEAEALSQYRARIEKAIHRRAITGVKEPVFWNGAVVGYVRRYSDSLLALHAKRHIREYGERVAIDQKTEHSGTVIGANLLDLDKLSPESRALLRQILEREAAKQATTEEESDGREEQDVSGVPEAPAD